MDKNFLNPHIQTFSGVVPEISRKTEVEKQEPAGDCSQNDPTTEVESYLNQLRNSFDSHLDESSHIVRTVEEEIPYCSPETSSGKQKKERSASQKQFRLMNTRWKQETPETVGPSTVGGQQKIRQFNSTINRISRLPKDPHPIETYRQLKITEFYTV